MRPGLPRKHILTSATKKVDVAVYDMIKAFKADPRGFRGGYNANYTSGTPALASGS